MKRLLKLLIPVLMVVILSSCNSVLVYHMDVLRPGAFVASSDKNSILLADNSGIQPPQFGHVILESNRYKQDTSFQTKPLSGILLKSVSDYLWNEHCYKQISLCERKDNPFRKDGEEDFLHSGKLTAPQIKTLGKSGRVDLLVSLDRLVIFSKTNVRPYDVLFRATRDVAVNSVWRVFDVSTDSLLAQFQYNDSLYWEAFSNGPKSAMKALPPMEETLPEIGDVVGGHVYKFFGPYWESVARSYFSSGSFRMNYAADCVHQNDWEGAAALWKEEFVKGSGRSVYRAAINMMLYSEFSGDPNEALAWGKKAEEAMGKLKSGATVSDRLLYWAYLDSLRTRALEFEKLKVYFNGHLN